MDYGIYGDDPIKPAFMARSVEDARHLTALSGDVRPAPSRKELRDLRRDIAKAFNVPEAMIGLNPPRWRYLWQKWTRSGR
jgi:hypothetical protein